MSYKLPIYNSPTTRATIIFMINNAQVFQGLQKLPRFFLEPRYAYSGTGCSYQVAKALPEAKHELLRNLAQPLPNAGTRTDCTPEAKCDYQLVREGVDPIQVLDHLDNIVRLVGAKLTAMQANPDAAFDRAELEQSDIIPFEASSSSSFRELYDWFEKIRENMNTVSALLPGALKVKWNNLQKQASHYFANLIQVMQDTVALARDKAKS